MNKYVFILGILFALSSALAKVPVTVMPGVVEVQLPSMTYLLSDEECPIPDRVRETIREQFQNALGDPDWSKKGELSCMLSSQDFGLFVTSLKLKLEIADYELLFEDAQNLENGAGILTQEWKLDVDKGQSVIMLTYYMADGAKDVVLYAYSQSKN